MIITCQNCGARYKIKDELVAGRAKRAKCKKCGEPILIKSSVEKPEAAAVESPPAPSPDDSVQVPDESADVSSRPAAETAEPGLSEEKVAVVEDAESGKSESEASQSEAESGEQESAARQIKNQEDIQTKLEKRRREMEDEISGRLHKAALETLDFDIIAELAHRIKNIEQNTKYKPEKNNQFFACIQCKTIFSLFPDDPRLCANCSGEVSLVRGDDILKQFGMFG